VGPAVRLTAPDRSGANAPASAQAHTATAPHRHPKLRAAFAALPNGGSRWPLGAHPTHPWPRSTARESQPCGGQRRIASCPLRYTGRNVGSHFALRAQSWPFGRYASSRPPKVQRNVCASALSSRSLLGAERTGIWLRAGPPTPPAHVLRRVSSSLHSCGPRLVRAAGRFAPRSQSRRPLGLCGRKVRGQPQAASRHSTPFAPATRGAGIPPCPARSLRVAPGRSPPLGFPLRRVARPAKPASPRRGKMRPGAGRKTSPRPHPPIKQATTLGRAKAKAHRPRYARRSITYDDCATSESAEAPNDRTGRQHHQRQRRCREPTHQHRRDRCHAQSR